METSNGPILVSKRPEPSRGPIRLQMVACRGRNRLAGGWWPRSRDFSLELADLVDHLPPSSGRIIRALISPGDWDPTLRRVPARGDRVKVGFSPRHDTHLIILTRSDRTMLCLLVVPPHFTDAEGEEALLLSVIAGRARSATELLREAVEHADMGPLAHWSDDGGSWSVDDRDRLSVDLA